MGIGSITSTNSMSARQMPAAGLKDQKSKSIQSEITEMQQKMQRLSSKEELSANEKMTERKQLRQEISGLNTELKQHQEELRRSQKRKVMLDELREDKEPAIAEQSEEEAKANAVFSDTADKDNSSTAEQQAAQPGAVITRNGDGTVMLKEAVNQNKSSDADTAKTGSKPAEEPAKETAAGKETKAAESDRGKDTTRSDDDESDKKMRAMVSADSSMQLAGRLGRVVSRTSDGIAVLKGEIKQDEIRGADTERKQAELEEMQKQEEREMTYQFSVLGEANNAMKSAAETNVPAGEAAQAEENTLYVSGSDMLQEEQGFQQKFYVSMV